MKTISILSLALFAVACAGRLHGNIEALKPRPNVNLFVKDPAALSAMIKLPKLEIPVYWAWNVAGMTPYEAKYHPDLPVDREDFVLGAVGQSIDPKGYKIEEYNASNPPSGDFILLMFDEERWDDREIVVIIKWGDKAMTPTEFSLRRTGDEMKKYCEFWWDVRTAIGDRFDSEYSTRFIYLDPKDI
ncbi:hypothetical protein JW758_03145 [Candidatus Peregrinibacteria bacterium]|nr:hypothetical protein [Candidatus Peregrinibacteria bacterium]